MAAMAPWMWFVGLAAMVGVAFVFPNPIILMILLLAGIETWRRWKARRAGGERGAGLLPRDAAASGSPSPPSTSA